MSEKSVVLSRRTALGAIGAAVLINPVSSVAAPARSALRIAHMTDIHVKPEMSGGEGFAAALQSLDKLSPRPEFIITGGDHVMDVLNATPERSDQLFALYRKVLGENTKLKVFPVVGNHDVFGWQLKNPDETFAGFGKSMVKDRLELPQTYYSFDRGSWHFIILDNVQRRGGSYFGDLDPEQTEWLKADLEKNGSSRPVVVFSHIPIASICAFFFNEKPKEFWKTGDHLMHRDSRALIKLLRGSNVKLCVSGHIHLLDQMHFMGLDFICDGAVCGAWWGGAFQDVPEGYGVIDLYDDGTHDYQYVTYGWKAKK